MKLRDKIIEELKVLKAEPLMQQAPTAIELLDKEENDNHKQTEI